VIAPEELRALLRVAREEGVLQLATPELSFSLGPKPFAAGSEPASDGKQLSHDEKLDLELFPDPVEG